MSEQITNPRDTSMVRLHHAQPQMTTSSLGAWGALYLRHLSSLRRKSTRNSTSCTLRFCREKRGCECDGNECNSGVQWPQARQLLIPRCQAPSWGRP